MSQRWNQAKKNGMYARTTGRPGSFVSYEPSEPCFLGINQYSNSRNRSNFYPPDYELGGMGQRLVQMRENNMYAMTTGRSGSFLSYERCEPRFLGHNQYSSSQNCSNFYPPDYELGGYYNTQESATTFKNPISNVYDEKNRPSDNTQRKVIPNWIRDELKKKISKNRHEHGLTTNEQNNSNFNNENISQILPHLLSKNNDHENHLINERIKNEASHYENDAELSKSKFKMNDLSIARKNMKLYQNLIVSKILIECTKVMMLKAVKKVLKAASPRESHVMDTRDNQSKIPLIDQLGIRAYCSESDSANENDYEHQATTPSHGHALQQNLDKTRQKKILKKCTTFYKTEKKIEKQLDQTEDQLKEYSHRDTCRVDKKNRSRSRSPMSNSRSKKNKSHSKKRRGIYSKHHEKSNDNRSRSRHHGSPISSHGSPKKYE